MKKIDSETGEIIDNEENYEIAKREVMELAAFDEWLEKKEALETAKQQFEFVDKPFRKVVKEIFDKYNIKKLDNDYMQIVNKAGYVKTSWDDEKVEKLIHRNDGNVDEYKKQTWVDGQLQIKYKG